MTGAYVVLSTVGSAGQAVEIGETLVSEGLAACVNVVPGLRSIYRWKGKVLQDDEVLMVLKTTAARYPAMEGRLREIHPYDCPEVLALEAAAGFERYLRWLGEDVEERTGPPPDEA